MADTVLAPGKLRRGRDHCRYAAEPRRSPQVHTYPSDARCKTKNGSDLENSVALAPSEKFARSPQAPQQVGAPLGWHSFEVAEFGTRVQIPAGIFIPAGKPREGSGQRFERADGRAVLSIYSRPNNIGESPATYLRQNLRVDRSALDYERIARSFFAISLERDGVILYSRCNFSSPAPAAIHCFDLTYPQEEKRSLGRCGYPHQPVLATAGSIIFWQLELFCSGKLKCAGQQL